jgi:hypothetical protein
MGNRDYRIREGGEAIIRNRKKYEPHNHKVVVASSTPCLHFIIKFRIGSISGRIFQTQQQIKERSLYI